MKTKIFAISGGYFRNISRTALDLEEKINAWIEANPEIKIIDIKQSSCGGSLEPSNTIISIWYELKGLTKVCKRTTPIVIVA